MHGSKLGGLKESSDEIHEALTRLFLPLNVRIFSTLEMTQSGMSDLISSPSYDVVGLVGEADEFAFVRRKSSGFSRFKFNKSIEESSSSSSSSEFRRDSTPIVLAFAPSSQFEDARSFLGLADAIVFCDASGKKWVQEMSLVLYHFFESLIVPSMLNIDLADVKHIAKGIGLAFNISEDTNNKIISRLPKSCLVARSALLHFSCQPDVRLREIYSVSKAVALKKGIPNFDPEINTHADAKKLIRKVNVKMGIRIRNGNRRGVGDQRQLGALTEEKKRISLTAILFGL